MIEQVCAANGDILLKYVSVTLSGVVKYEMHFLMCSQALCFSFSNYWGFMVL